MTPDIPHVPKALFLKRLEDFKRFIRQQGGVPFQSFAHHYTDRQESYKYDIYKEGREQLSFQAWKEEDIGSGKILEAAIQAIEISSNNLVQWQAKYGEERQPHHLLHVARDSKTSTIQLERILYELYYQAKEADAFSQLVDYFGKKYSLIAYFLFLKDRNQFLPLAPEYMDKASELLGINFKTSRKCSWENYSIYLEVMGEIKNLLSEELGHDVSLLDTHSFTWILSNQMERQGAVSTLSNEIKTERESTVTARVGQDKFRKEVEDYWSICSVTGCSVLLYASHIKPWRSSSHAERLDPFNGLLLSPALDNCFDKGYISFDDTGNIIISNLLSKKDKQTLGLHESMKLSKIEQKHKDYLNYHRENIFESFSTTSSH